MSGSKAEREGGGQGGILRIGHDLLETWQDSGVKYKTIRKLVAGGVPHHLVGEVLDLREALTIRDPEKNWRQIAAPTVDQMLQAWQACEGDMQALEYFVDQVMEHRKEELATILATSKSGSLSSLHYQVAITNAFNRALGIAQGQPDKEDRVEFEDMG